MRCFEDDEVPQSLSTEKLTVEIFMSFKISHRASQIEDSFLKLFAVGVFVWFINFTFGIIGVSFHYLYTIAFNSCLHLIEM